MAQKLKIGIQGVKASFHDMAAREYFRENEIELVECNSFRKLCESLAKEKADFCLMAIENTIAGSILPNYALLENYKFEIIGEVYLRIEMNLMALPGQKIKELKSIQSHPMALLQCSDFLAQYGEINIVEANDTAESAKDIKEKNLTGIAAIASRLAAEDYGLELLAEGIENNKSNYTRFLVLSRDKRTEPIEVDKASINFHLIDRIGILADIMTCFKDNHVNLTKIQSIPIVGKPFEYSFHADMIWKDYQHFENAMRDLKEFVTELNIYGKYKEGDKKYDRPNGRQA